MQGTSAPGTKRCPRKPSRSPNRVHAKKFQGFGFHLGRRQHLLAHDLGAASIERSFFTRLLVAAPARHLTLLLPPNQTPFIFCRLAVVSGQVCKDDARKGGARLRSAAPPGCFSWRMSGSKAEGQTRVKTAVPKPRSGLLGLDAGRRLGYSQARSGAPFWRRPCPPVEILYPFPITRCPLLAFAEYQVRHK